MASIINTIQTTLSENFTGLAQAVAPSDTKFAIEDVPDLSGKVAVVTGGSNGIGYAVVHTLLAKGSAKVFILSTSEEIFSQAKATIKEEVGEQAASRMHWIQCDLSEWKKVAKIAKEISSSTDRLDIMVNNAGRGIMTFQLTDYGVDRHMAINHFGHVLLTSHLLPLLKKTADQGHIVRITNQASNAHEGTPKETKFANLEELNTDYGPMPQYGRSKLAAILYSRYLARHLTSQHHPKILINATHPGVVETKMSRDDIHEPYPIAGYLMSKGLQPFKKDIFEGSLSSLYAATVTEKSGEYICPPAAPEPGSELAQNKELGEQLMQLTREVLEQKMGEKPPNDY